MTQTKRALDVVHVDMSRTILTLFLSSFILTFYKKHKGLKYLEILYQEVNLIIHQF